MSKALVITANIKDAMEVAKKPLAENRFVSIRPAWIYNETTGDYDRKYIVEEDYVHQRPVEEIIGDKTIDELKDEIIEIQRHHMYQSYVVSELNKRYNATPDEIAAMLFKTDTRVPNIFKSLNEWKYSGKWPGDLSDKKSNLFS